MRTLDAVTMPLDGRHLIEASAGTGKTYTIATLFLRLVVEAKLAADRILVVTYTDAAASELRDRIRARLQEAIAALDLLGTGVAAAQASGDGVLVRLLEQWDPEEARDRLSRAVAAFDLAPVSTIHSYCQKALREHAFESGMAFDATLTTDDAALIAETALDLWTSHLYDQPVAVAERVPLRERRATDVTEVVRKAVAAAESRFVPEVVEDPGLEPAWQRLVAAWQAVAAGWSEAGEQLVALLAGHAALNKATYGAQKVVPAGAIVGLWLAAGPRALGEEDLKKLSLFSSRLVADKTNKGAKVPPPQHPLLAGVDGLLDALGAYDAAVALTATGVLASIAQRARGVFDAIKGEGVLVFDDLLAGLRAALRGQVGRRLAAALARRYPAALIDEFQDTDPVQYEIFDTIYREPGTRLMLIGDPKQAIYAFRGADLHTYLRARGDVGEAVWSMGTNWRSDRPLVEAVGLLFGVGDDPFHDRQIDFQEVRAHHGEARLRGPSGAEPALQLRLVPCDDALLRTEAVVRAVVDDLIDTLHKELEIERGGGWQPVGPGDIAVLVGRHSEGQKLQDALTARGVPSVRYGKTSVYASPEAADLLAVLDAVLLATPGRLRAALVTPLFGLDARGILLTHEDDELQRRLMRLRGWRRTWERRGVAHMLQELMREQRVYRRLLARRGGERVLTNTRHLVELVHAAERREGLGPLGLVAWLRQQVQDAEEDDDAELRLESDALAVQIVTMHSSKGLEYPVVFCPFLGWSREPSEPVTCHDDEGGRVVDLGSPELAEHKARALAESRQEQMRLAYVALTRARHRCTVYWGRAANQGYCFHGSALAHLLHPAPGDWTSLPSQPAKGDGAEGRMWERLQEIARAAPAAIAASRVEAEREPATYTPERPQRSRFLARSVTRRHGGDLRITSFSGLVSRQDDDGLDHDAVDLPRAAVEAEEGELALLNWPRGAAAGTCYHAIMEELDFTEPTAQPARRLVQKLMQRFGIPSTHVEATLRSLDEVCRTEIAPGVRLIDVPRSDRADELDFVLPVGAAGSSLSPWRLGEVFRRHGGAHLAGAYADRLQRLEFEPMYGALKGFVDLVFRRDGRWWLVDYKTNHLGETLGDYVGKNLEDAMVDHDYLLQYHLYTVALHRFLRSRLRGYDYERDFGGVRYLFVRGMHPRFGWERGVYADRPPLALIEALDALLAGARP
jgi:exodeoxyribonuclease V beta subunit